MAEPEGPSLPSHSLGGEVRSDEGRDDVEAEVRTISLEPADCPKQSMAVCCGKGSLPSNTSWVERHAATRMPKDRSPTLYPRSWAPHLCLYEASMID